MSKNRQKTPGRGTDRRFVSARRILQLAAAALCNGYAAGFAGKKIYNGPGKYFCVPVLNCYSCPGALGSCPIGSLQAVAGGGRFRVSFYVLGLLMLFGTLAGRLVCGFLCPFGFLQDLLYRIPVPKPSAGPFLKKLDRGARYLKYGILAVLVFLLPMLVRGPLGTGTPWFCKLVCPAGTLAGLFHVSWSPALRQMIGLLFDWKVLVLVFVLVLSMFVSRPFCRYFCPLGAFYSLFHRFSLFRLKLDREKCVDCGRCEIVCPMALNVREKIDSGECIRCMECKKVCPTGAICGRSHEINTFVGSPSGKTGE